MNGIERSHIQVLAALTRLRQICCHPSLFIDNYKGESGKLNQCIEIVKDAIQSGHKILLFSGYTAMFEIIEKAAAEQVEITLVFSYIREYMLDYITELLDEINRWCEEKRQSVEIVVNDWGTAHLAAHFPVFSICLGILLNKRKKIPGWPTSWETAHYLRKTASTRHFTVNI